MSPPPKTTELYAGSCAAQEKFCRGVRGPADSHSAALQAVELVIIIVSAPADTPAI